MLSLLKHQSKLGVFGKLLLISIVILELAACTQASSSFIQQEMTETAQAIQPTATKTQQPTATATATITPEPTATFTATATTVPFDLEVFSPRLFTGVSSYAYIDDTCTYLADRWGKDKSSPNTVVVPIMYHSVRKAGKPVNDAITVPEEYFLYTMDYAKKLGFETVTMDELIAFMYRNEPIPERSMILIIDDRRPGVARDNFMPILKENDWEVSLAYITGVAAEWEWTELEMLYKTGRIDVQSHGFMHQPDTYFTEYTSMETIEQEVYGAIPLIEQHFGVRPNAFVWPGGNFTPESIEVVHEAGYQIGFTAYSRGPLFFNWVPLGDEESEMNDPLMVLPRYWSSAATVNMDEAIELQEKMMAFNEENRSEEYRWYQAFCPGYPALRDMSED